MAMALAAFFLLLLALAAPSVYGVDHTVGGSSGWGLSGNYDTWATGETFKVGDNLVFNYDSSSHKVAVVNANDYSSCSASNALKTYDDGNTKVALTSAGKMYFICPVTGHCSGGMKLAVNVVADSNTPSGTPSTPATPSPPSGSSTPATTTTAPPPPHNGAVGGFGTVSHMIGSLFVSAIILVCMS